MFSINFQDEIPSLSEEEGIKNISILSIGFVCIGAIDIETPI